MGKIENKHIEIIKFFEENRNEANVKKYAKYFKEGFDSYGVDSNIYMDQAEKWRNDWGNDWSNSDLLELGDHLVRQRKYEEKSIALRIMSWLEKDYNKEIFNHIGKWFEKDIDNWGHTDASCGLVLVHFVLDNIIELNDFNIWIESSSKWKRRAVPVTLYEAFKKGYNYKLILPFIEPLMEDPEEDVQKGLGTLLREIWKKHPEDAEIFLMKWKNTCGRKIIHYATEKMDKEYRKKFKKEIK